MFGPCTPLALVTATPRASTAGVTISSRPAATELSLPPEILATRRDLEQLTDGNHDGAVMSGWRREVIGERLLAAL